LFDLYPTLCDLAGIPVPSGLDAKSLAPVIKGEQATVRDTLFTAYKNCQRSIRDDRWKLIRYPLINKTQLFDLQADPQEMTDLAGKSESADKIKELTALLEKTRKESGDSSPLQVANPAPAEWTPPTPESKLPKKEGLNGKQ
jgi:arylsulfatase A-like enzyme